MTASKKTHPWQKKYPKAVDWNAPIAPKRLDSLLDDSAAKYPNNPCIDFLDKKHNYAEVLDNVNRLAKGLQSLGVCKGDRIGLLFPNTPYSIIAYYAVLRVGAVVVNLSPLASFTELSNQVEKTGMRHIISVDLNILYEKIAKLMQAQPMEHAIIASFEKALPFPKNKLFRWFKSAQIASVPYGHVKIAWDSICDNDGDYTAVEIDPVKDVAVLQFTGGTTGTPKAAKLTHANLYANALQCGMWFSGMEAGEEKMAGVLPFFHVFAMTVIMNLGIHKACEIILYPKPDVPQLLKDVKKKQLTLLPGVPTLFHGICNYPKVGAYDLTSLKACISGGAPLLAATREQFESMTGAALIEGYGLTESSPVASANPLDGSGKDGSIGIPLPQTQMEIRSPEGRHKLMPKGEVGEVCIIAPQVMQGYLDDDKETANVIKNKRLHTGDMGYMDEDGYVFIVDRLKELIITSGYNVYPREVEEALSKHRSVLEVAVIGVADDCMGQVIKAFVVPKMGESITESEVKAFCKDKLSRYKVPRKVEIRESLPKTMVGKIAKKELS